MPPDRTSMQQVATGRASPAGGPGYPLGMGLPSALQQNGPPTTGTPLVSINPGQTMPGSQPLGPPHSAQSPTNPGYPWSTRQLRLYQPPTNPPAPPMSPFPRYGLSVPPYPSHSGHMLLFGGLVGERAHNDLWSLDVRDCSLQLVKTRGEAPLPRIGHVSAIADRVMLVFGGDTKINEDDQQDSGLYVLDLRTQEWTSVPVATGPSGRYGHAACLLGGCFYVHGGHVDGRNLDDLWSFDIRQLGQETPNGQYKWERVSYSTPAPLARTGHTLVPYRNKLYLFGGTDGDYHYNDSWSFDVATGAWTELECIGYIPIPREGHAAAIVDDVIYVFGGRDVHGKDLGDLAAFRISNQRWYMFQNMGPTPMAKSGHSLCAAHGKVFVIGGESNLSNLSQRDDPNTLHVLDTTKIKYPTDSQAGRPQTTRPRTTSDATDRRPSPGGLTSPYGAGQTGPDATRAAYLASRSHDNLARSMSPSTIFGGQGSEQRPLVIANDTGNSGSKGTGRNESQDWQGFPPGAAPPSAPGQQQPGQPGVIRPNGVPPQRPKREGDDEFWRAMSPTSPGGFGGPQSGPNGEMNYQNFGAPNPNTTQAPISSGNAPSLNGSAHSHSNSQGNIPMSPERKSSLNTTAAVAGGVAAGGAIGAAGAAAATNGSASGIQSPTPVTAAERALMGQGPDGSTSGSPIHPSHTIHPNPRNSRSPPPQLRLDGNGRPALPADAFYFGGGGRSPTGTGSRPTSINGRPGSLLGRPGSIVGNRPGSIVGTADLLRELKARETEADNAKRREAALRVVLSRAIKEGFVVEDDSIDVPSPDMVSDDDQVRQLVKALVQLKHEKSNLQNDVAAQVRQMSDKMYETERLQKSALQEAAYYRAKLQALETNSPVQISRLESERIAELEHQLESTANEYSKNKAELDRLQSEVSRHQEISTSATDREAETLKRAEEAEEENAALREQLEEIRARADGHEKSLRDHNERFITLTSTHNQREAERDQYKSQLDDLTAKHEDFTRMLEEAQLAIVAAGNRSDELENLHGQAKEHISHLEQEIADLRHQLDVKEREVEAANARAADAENMHNQSREEITSLRSLTTGRLGELVTSSRSLNEDSSRSLKGHQDQLRALEEEKSSLLKLLREAGQRVDATEALVSTHRQKQRDVEQSHNQLRSDLRVHRTKLMSAQTEMSKYRDAVAAKDAELRDRDLAVTELQTRVHLLRKLLGEHGVNITDNELDNAEAPSTSELESQLREKARAHENAQREIDELTRRCHEAEDKVESLGRLVERMKDARSSSAGSVRSPSPGGTQSDTHAHSHDPATRAVEAERRLADVETQYKEKIAALEGDYQTAVRYVKGTEKMLKRMKDELNKQKATNTALLAELDQLRGRSSSTEPGSRAFASGRGTPSDGELSRRLTTLQSQYSTLQAELQASQDVLSARNREVDLLRMRSEEADRENEALREDLAQAQHRIATLLEMNQADMHLGSDDEERMALRRGSSASSDGGTSMAFDKFTKELKQWERARSPDAHSVSDDEKPGRLNGASGASGVGAGHGSHSIGGGGIGGGAGIGGLGHLSGMGSMGGSGMGDRSMGSGMQHNQHSLLANGEMPAGYGHGHHQQRISEGAGRHSRNSSAYSADWQ